VADDRWWTLNEASDRAGLGPEAIRKWALKEPPRVRSRMSSNGNKPIREVLAEDVTREAAVSLRARRRSPANASGSAPAPGFQAQDQLSTLDEVVRLQRVIDALRDEIEERHVRIGGLHREIGALLQAPSAVPNN
jgi:hypothetical protein